MYIIYIRLLHFVIGPAMLGLPHRKAKVPSQEPQKKGTRGPTVNLSSRRQRVGNTKTGVGANIPASRHTISV